MISVRTLRAAGLTAEQIVRVIETEENERLAARREQNRINQQNHRSRQQVSADVNDNADAPSPPSFSPSTPTPITTPPSCSSLRSEVIGSTDPIARPKLKYPAAFEGWWLAYPKSPIMSKKEAASAWARLPEDDRLRAVAAIAPYRKFLAEKPDHPAVHACRFLSQRRFETLLSETTGPPAGGYQPPPGAVSFIDKMRGKSNGHLEGTGVRQDPGMGDEGPGQPPKLLVPS